MIDGKYLNHLHFADDIVQIASNEEYLMLTELNIKSKNRAENEHWKDKVHDQ